jgi:hypothetical protein
MDHACRYDIVVPKVDIPKVAVDVEREDNGGIEHSVSTAGCCMAVT